MYFDYDEDYHYQWDDTLSWMKNQELMNSEENRRRRYCRSSRHYTTKNFNVKGICDEDVVSKFVKTHDGVEIRKVMVANVDFTTTHKELEYQFSEYGRIVDCILKKKKGQKKNYAFITYQTTCEALKAIRAGYNKKIAVSGQYLRVIPAVSWHQPDHSENQNQRTLCDEISNVAKNSNEKTTTVECINYVTDDDSPIHKLNNDCLMIIFNFLSYIDRIKIERVCKRWQIVNQDNWHLQKKFDLSPMNWKLTNSARYSKEHQINACSIYNIISKCNYSLTHVDLSGSRIVDNQMLIGVFKLCPKLKLINLKNCDFKPSAIRALAKNCRNLSSFIVSNNLSEEIFDEISYLFATNQKLKHIEISYKYFKGKRSRNFPIKSLQKLVIYFCRMIGTTVTLFTDFFNSFSRIQELESLKMINLYYHQKTMEMIGLLPKLKVLELPSINYSRKPIEVRKQIGYDNALTPTTNLINLEILDLSKNDMVTDNFLITLAENCTKLSKLDISFCKNVTNEGLACIVSLPELEDLSMEGLDQVTDDVFIDIPNLKSLNCKNCINIRDTGLIRLINTCEKLELLDLTGCLLISNDLINSASKVMDQKRHRVLKLIISDACKKIDNISDECHQFFKIQKK